MGHEEQPDWLKESVKRQNENIQFEKERFATEQLKKDIEKDERLRGARPSVNILIPDDKITTDMPVPKFFAWTGGGLLFVIGIIWYYGLELPNIFGIPGFVLLNVIAVFCLLMGFLPGLMYVIIIAASVMYIYWDIAFPTDISLSNISFHSFIGIAIIIGTVTSFKRYFARE